MEAASIVGTLTTDEEVIATAVLHLSLIHIFDDVLQIGRDTHKREAHEDNAQQHHADDDAADLADAADERRNSLPPNRFHSMHPDAAIHHFSFSEIPSPVPH